jgi:hypothetical protein
MRRSEHVLGMEEMKNAYKIFVGKHQGRDHLGRCRRIWGDNIKIGLSEKA